MQEHPVWPRGQHEAQAVALALVELCQPYAVGLLQVGVAAQIGAHGQPARLGRQLEESLPSGGRATIDGWPEALVAHDRRPGSSYERDELPVGHDTVPVAVARATEPGADQVAEHPGLHPLPLVALRRAGR